MHNIPADKLEPYETLVATNPDVKRKGAANPYTSSGTLALRLPEEERERFLKKYQTTLFEAYGCVMKEYVTVPDGLLKKTRELERYFDLSYQYVGRLRSKPAKKKS